MKSHAMRAIPAGWTETLPTKDFAVGHDGAIGMWITGDEIVRIQDGRGLLLQVTHGSAWVTQAGSIKDVFVDAGESFRLELDGRTLVSAGRRASTAVVTLTRPARSGLLQGWAGAIPEWLHWGSASAGPRAGSFGRLAS